jgi:hypothetical protein
MANFAELDDNNVVLRVNVVNNEDTQDSEGNELESIGISFCESTWGGRWIQTSYNHNIRGRYAGIGMVYDEDHDSFTIPKEHESFVWSDEFIAYVPPVPLPDKLKPWMWDQDTQSWIDTTPTS